MTRAAALSILLSAASAEAESPEPIRVTRQAEAAAPRTYVNLRGGVATGTRRPELCLDVAPLEFLFLEACGTGSGFLHRDPAPETAHFRAHLRLTGWETKLGFFAPLVGAGFGEIQIGEDDPGFQFAGVGGRGVETAGPELTSSARWVYPIGAGLEMVGQLTLGLLWAPHAPELVLPRPALQPFFSATVGVGF